MSTISTAHLVSGPAVETIGSTGPIRSTPILPASSLARVGAAALIVGPAVALLSESHPLIAQAIVVLSCALIAYRPLSWVRQQRERRRQRDRCALCSCDRHAHCLRCAACPATPHMTACGYSALVSAPVGSAPVSAPVSRGDR